MERHDRTAQTDPPRSVPWTGDEPDVVCVESTWGELQPLQSAPGVRTLGELELVAAVQDGAVLVDSRTPGSFGGRSIPGSVNIPHDEAVDRRDELPSDALAVLFCNGPQCPQSPDALRQLVEAGHPAERLAYYRGGMHDWITLGMPTEPRED